MPSGKTVADFPHLVAQFDCDKNGGRSPKEFAAGSHEKIHWKCSVAPDHEWTASPNQRTNPNHLSDCPCCDNKKIVGSNCLATLDPAIAAQWHPTLNGELSPFNVGPGSGKRVWWKCPRGPDHVWDATINNRTGRTTRTGCPCCNGKMVVVSNCLATTDPKTADEMHPIKNGDITPFGVTRASSKLVYWLCPVGHEWRARIAHRTRAENPTGCPDCNRGHLGENAIAQYLREHGVHYRREVQPPTHKFRFDFMAPWRTAAGAIMIEFHGAQHYYPVRFGGMSWRFACKRYDYTVAQDKKKEQWCKAYGIRLLVIPFWDYDVIDDILDDLYERNRWPWMSAAPPPEVQDKMVPAILGWFRRNDPDGLRMMDELIEAKKPFSQQTPEGELGRLRSGDLAQTHGGAVATDSC